MRLKDNIISAKTGLDAIKRAPIIDEDTGLKCIRIQDISQKKDFNDWGNTFVSEMDYKKHLLKKNDILIARTGATVGVSYFLEDDLESVFNNGTIRLKFNKNVNSKFIYYIFKTKEFLTFIDNVSCVATQPNLRIETLLRFTIPDIKLEKQNRIVNILNNYDQLIENNNKRIKILEDMAESLYKEWFVRFRFPGHETAEFENGIPLDWQIVQISEIAEVVGGGTPATDKEEYWNGNIPWLSPVDLNNFVGVYIDKGSTNITELGYKKSSTRIMPKNTILFSSRAPIGYLAIAKNNICTNQGFKNFVCNEKCIYTYLFLYLKNNVDYLKQFANGSTFPELSTRTLNKIKILLPNMQIMTLFHKKVKQIFDLIDNYCIITKNIKQQRDVLLPRLMSGKLEV